MESMETSPTQDNQNQQSFLPSPNSHSSSISSSSSTASSNSNCNSTYNNNNNNNNNQPYLPLPSPRPITRSESANPCPTTFVQADTSSFKQVVQMLTGSPRSTASAPKSHPDPTPKSHAHNIPPIKTIPKKNQSSGFKLYERRNSLKNFKINPLNPIFSQPSSGFSPRKPEILSPSVLGFPALVLSPVTPLIPDPFDRSGPVNYANCDSPRNNHNTNNNNNRDGNSVDTDAEERGIKEKGFYLHPSPATTPREAEPRLLPLFPIASPRLSGSVNP